MIAFQPSDPFPLLEPGRHSHAEARAHAAVCDMWLGLGAEAIECELMTRGFCARAPGASGEKQKLWFGLDVQALLTPYVELRALLEKLHVRPGQTLVDLGAAYGRMGFVLSRHVPGARFIGYEYVGERVAEGRRALKRFGAESAELLHADLAAHETCPADADFYFIYDFGTIKAIEKALHDIRRISLRRPIRLIARGRHCRYLISTRHPWLENAYPAESEERVTIYRPVGAMPIVSDVQI